MSQHLKGHDSLAEMVSTHIAVWRALLERARDASPETGSDEDCSSSDADSSYFTHELRALADIEEACRVEMSPAAPAMGR